MSNVLIVEDEMITAKGLEAIIKSIDSQLKVDMTAYAREALSMAKSNDYDVFLLDIQLKDYSGFDLAHEIREIDKCKLTPIIFITAIPSRELMAFKQIHAYDYIIKPFKEEEVINSLETIIKYGINMDTKKEDKYLKLKQRDFSYLIRQDEIIYLEYKNRRLFIKTIKDEFDISTYTLKQILKELENKFLQCHRGFIINTDYIEKIDKTEDNIYLKGISDTIPIGRAFKESIRSKIDELS